MVKAYSDHREAALTLLTGKYLITRRAGQFLGQLAVDASPLSEAQIDWLGKLLKKNGLPRYEQSAGHGPLQQPGG